MPAKKKAPPAPQTNGTPATMPDGGGPKSSRMTKAQLQGQVHALETEVARLRAELEEIRGPQVPWWQKISGSSADDPAFHEAMRLGREWRESFRPKPRKKTRKANSSDGHT